MKGFGATMADANEAPDPLTLELLAKFEKTLAPLMEWLKAAAELVQESDRSCVLMVCAILDDLLERLLRTKFKVSGNPSKAIADSLLTDAMAPIGSLAVRTKLAISLGIIGQETLMVLDGIRSLRNRFAHRWRSARMTMEQLDSIFDKLSDDSRTMISEARSAIEKISEAMKEKYPKFYEQADPSALDIRFRFLALSLTVFFTLVETIRGLDKSFVRDEIDEFIDLCKQMKSHEPNWESTR